MTRVTQETTEPVRQVDAKPKREPKKVDKRIAALRRFALTITMFTILGHLLLGVETSWAAPVIALVTAYSTALLLETVDAWANGRRAAYRGGPVALLNFLLPAHIAALAIGLLIFPGSRLWPFAFAAMVAVSAKYLFRAPVHGTVRHVMNPSNLGITATLVLFPWVGIGLPYHFTETFGGALDWIVPLLLLASGLMLNLQLTGKWPLIAAWTLGFAGQAVIRSLFTDISLLGALAPMTGVAFILFTNYMITDPGTSPSRPRNQVIFGLATAAAYGAFMVANIAYGIFYALAVVCALRGALHWYLELTRRRRARATASVPSQRADAPTALEPVS